MVAAVSTPAASLAILNQYRATIPSTGLTLARDILEKRLTEGTASARGLLERMQREVPIDQVARSTALEFGYDPDATAKRMALTLTVDGQRRMVHRHAQQQLASRANVPNDYLERLLSTGWGRDLAVRTMADHFRQDEDLAKRRHLVRSVGGEVRGVLSDKYRRLDNAPLLEAMAEVSQKLGAVPYAGTSSDVRVALKVVIPTILEPVPGEYVVLGLEWGNSDFGAGAHGVRAFLLRCWCLNGATAENLLREVHLGKRLDESVVFSQRTYALDTKASVSALRDVVGLSLGAERVDLTMRAIKAAHEEQVDWKRDVAPVMAKYLSKEELKQARESFESNDVHNLPAGNTLWRASNALSWLAGHATDSDKKLDLERAAGAVLKITGKATPLD